MRFAVACAALLCMVVVGPTWCAEENTAAAETPRGHYYAMVGHFWPTDGDHSGSTAVGLQYVARASGPHFGVEYTRASHTRLAAGVPTELDLQAISPIIGRRTWRGRWYYGAGAGVSFLRREVGTAAGVTTEHETNAVWELVAGVLFGRRGLVDLRYIDAGADGARGFAGFIGIRF